MGSIISTNKFQTPVNEELKKSLHKEVYDNLMEYLGSVKFIQNLIDPNRPYIADRPVMTYINEEGEEVEYEDGRRVVDLTNPHILENMDYFRERAIFFEKYGKYTNIPPNPNPNSDYANFWREELYKWRAGVVRPDGEWIPGELYFYWNYSPIWLQGKSEGSKSSKRGERIRAFPKPWLGDYLFHHYIHQAKEMGSHGKLLKCRGVGFSFKSAAWSPRNMYVHPGSGNPNFHLASEKSFLSGDKGIWGKVLDTLDWIADNTPLPRMRLVDGKRAMELQMGYEDEYGVRRGLLSSVFGISLKDNPDKARGIRGPLIHYEEDGLFPDLEKAWNVNRKAVEDGGVATGFMLAGGCLTENNFVWTNDGKPVCINKITRESGIVGYDGNESYKEKVGWFKEPEEKECVRIHIAGGDFIECSIDHPIMWTKSHWRKFKDGEYIGKKCTLKDAGDIKAGEQILKIDKLDIFGSKEEPDARLYGLMVGDGNLSENSTPSLSCDSEEVFEYIKERYNYTEIKKFITKDGGTYRQLGMSGNDEVFDKSTLRGLDRLDKRFPTDINEYDKKSLSEFIGGYYDADGNVYHNKKRNNIRIVLTSMSESLLKEMKIQLSRFGIHGNITREFRKGGYNPNTYVYRFYITSYTDVLRFKENIPLLTKYKKDILDLVGTEVIWRDTTRTEDHYFELGDNMQGEFFERRGLPLKNTRTQTVKKVEFIGKQVVYNLHTTHTNTYLANNFITKQTGGTSGGSFEGSEKLFYNPDAYNIYSLPNVFDKNADGTTKCGFFWGSYLSRNNCYELENGEPDVIKALIEVLKTRFTIKYGSSDSNAVTQAAAEDPITPQEAIMRTEGTVFPVADLKSYMEEIAVKRESFLAEHFVGDLVYNSIGQVEWKPNGDITPIRTYDFSSDNRTGAVEIFEMPKKNAEGVIARGRYGMGIDPIDSDTGQSLFSVLVMDFFTDRIVAEYTGRPRLATDAYEIALKLAMFYNAEINYESNLKGLFSYFENKNALHYLCNTPQILKDMDVVKGSLFGNAAKGTRASSFINSWGRMLQAEWLMTRIDENDEDDLRLKMHTVRSLGYLDELIRWNKDGNFDRVSAGGMLFILREDRYKRTAYLRENPEEDKNSLANDPFFNKNYDANRY